MTDIIEHNPSKTTAFDRLPRRLRTFVREYVPGASGSDAMRKAGYKGLYPHVVAYKALQKPEVKEAVEEYTRMHMAELGVRAERVIRETLAIATSDPRRLVDSEGKQIPFQDLDAATAAAISSIEIEQISTQGLEGTRYKYKLWDKTKSLDKLGQYLKLWDASRATVNVDARSVTVNNTVNGAEALSGAVRLLEQVRTIAVDSAATVSDTNGPLFPVAIRDESQGRGTPVDVGEDT